MSSPPPPRTPATAHHPRPRTRFTAGAARRLARPAALLRAALLATTLLVGCAAHDHLKSADRAMASADYGEAVRQYEAALDLKPGWADDPELSRKLERARREYAVTTGSTLLADEQWQRAIAQFEAALAIDPDHVPAQQGLTRARRGGAQHAYERALRLADEAKLDAARQALEEAIALNRDHPEAHAALRSIRSPGAHPEAAAVQRYEAGRALADERRWLQAEAQFREAIVADGNYLPARGAAAQAREKLSTANRLYEQGVAYAEAKKLDDAIDALDTAHRTWPYHPRAADRLEQVVRLRTESDELAQQASDALAERRWDRAIDAATESLAIFPDHAQAQSVAELARDRAAAAHAAAGQDYLEAGQLDQAEAAFEAALGYRATHAPARRGMAAVGHRRANDAERRGWLGLALLYRMDAAEHHYTREDAGYLDTLRSRLADQASFTLMLNSDHPDRAVAADSASFQTDLAAALKRTAPAFIAIGSAAASGGENETNGNGDANAAPAVVADVHVLAIDVDQTRTGAEHRRHGYEIEHRVPNPALPHLAAAVHHHQRDVHDLRHRRDHARDRFNHARRHPPHDEDKRRAHEHELRHLRDHLGDIERDLHRAEHELHIIEHKLRAAPSTVIEIEHASWPYTRYTYRKSAHMVVRLALREPGQDPATAGSFTVEAEHDASDTTIDNPNPAIGLRDDPLHLPSDVSLRDHITDEAARDAAAIIVRRTTEARVAALQAQADELLAVNRADEALEHDVQALVLLRAIDRREAEGQLRQLALPDIE